MAAKFLLVTILLFASAELLNFQRQKLQPVCRKALKIRKFVNTQEAIWTHSTTARFYIRCKVDVRTSITKKLISFRRKYYTDEGRHWLAKKLDGLFSEKQKDVMQICPPGERVTEKEAVLYIGAKYDCALIKVTPAAHDHKSHFDLRVWNSSIIHGVDPSCLRMFAGFKEHGRVIYGPRCQDILTVHSNGLTVFSSNYREGTRHG
nr:uncharacterized protein LOC126534052 [Dermacentor andersoni]